MFVACLQGKAAMVEHDPFEGKFYKTGIDSKRVAIMAYSHHRKPDEVDTSEFTIDVVTAFLKGESKPDTVFPNVPNYFEFTDQNVFWESVLFFNYIPECIGTTAEMSQEGTDEQKARGNARFLKLVAKFLPDQVFVFTSAGWQRNLQTTLTSFVGLGDPFPHYRQGLVKNRDHTTRVYCLRHPNYADHDDLRRAVTYCRQIG